MSDRHRIDHQQAPDLSTEELEQQQAADLPDREALSLIEPGLGMVELGGTLDQSAAMPSLDPSDPQTLPAIQDQPLPVDQTTL